MEVGGQQGHSDFSGRIWAAGGPLWSRSLGAQGWVRGPGRTRLRAGLKAVVNMLGSSTLTTGQRKSLGIRTEEKDCLRTGQGGSTMVSGTPVPRLDEDFQKSECSSAKPRLC